VPRDSFSIPIHIQVEAEGHPCPKSIKAWSWLVENFSEQNDLLYEPFGGSGTTIIAAETLHRRCFAVEIEPKFCQLIIDRFERFTSAKAQKLGELVSQ
jgi:DNA modification methylase